MINYFSHDFALESQTTVLVIGPVELSTAISNRGRKQGPTVLSGGNSTSQTLGKKTELGKVVDVARTNTVSMCSFLPTTPSFPDS